MTMNGIRPAGPTPLSVDQLIARHHQRILSYLVHHAVPFDDAEDLAQDIVVRLWRNRHRTPLEHVAGTYAERCAHNAIVDLIRAQQRSKGIAARMARCGYQWPAEPSTPDQLLDERLTLELYDYAVSTLPRRCRMTYRLSAVGTNRGEIARRLRIGEKTVDEQLRRARAHIKLLLSGID